MSITVSFTLNGEPVSAEVDNQTLLVEMIRDQLGRTGTHIGCDTSQCGACVIHVDGRSVKSCTMLAVQAEGADVAVFAGDRRGIIYVQGERVANVPEPEILDRLLEECRSFQAKVRSGEATLGEKKVQIIPPDPLGELGSGQEKIAAGQVEQVTVGRT